MFVVQNACLIRKSNHFIVKKSVCKDLLLENFNSLTTRIQIELRPYTKAYKNDAGCSLSATECNLPR